MRIQFNPRHLQLTQPIASFASDKLSHLDALSETVISANVVLTHDQVAEPSKRFTVKVRLAVPGRDVHAAETARDIYSAIDGVEMKLARQLRKRKTRMKDRATRRLQRARERVKDLGAD